MQQDEADDIQNSNLVSSDLASQLAASPAPVTQQAGQQFVPSAPTHPSAPASPIGSDLPEPPAPVTFTPPAPEEPAVPAADENKVDEALNALSAPTEPTPAVSPYKVEPEEVGDITAPELKLPDDSSDASEPDELDGIKLKALSELKPLVGKLDLTPEKRYDLLMEIIQASNDKSLLDEAYEAAHKIEDDDLKAQALMEVVNEIEYLKGLSKDA